MIKKAIGFYLSAAAAVLCAAGVVLYSKANIANPAVVPLLAADVVLAIIVLALVAVKGDVKGSNLLPVVNTVLSMLAFALSAMPMASLIVYVLVGMNAASSIQGYIYFVIPVVIAYVLNLIAAFCGVTKKNLKD